MPSLPLYKLLLLEVMAPLWRLTLCSCPRQTQQLPLVSVTLWTYPTIGCCHTLRWTCLLMCLSPVSVGKLPKKQKLWAFASVCLVQHSARQNWWSINDWLNEWMNQDLGTEPMTLSECGRHYWSVIPFSTFPLAPLTRETPQMSRNLGKSCYPVLTNEKLKEVFRSTCSLGILTGSW